MSHTPGPWFWSARTMRREVYEEGAPSTSEDVLGVDTDRCIFAYNDADARLIAAAPDLLEALKAICGALWDGEHPTREAFDKARAAIATAEGA